MNTHRTTNGFSLIELAIVLAIIGLLAGAVIGGQSMIQRAKITAVVNDAGKYIDAFSQFQQQYKALPGDYLDATEHWGIDPDGCPSHANRVAKKATCNGNGNGTIDLSLHYETFRAWQHMATAGLLDDAYTGVSGAAGVNDARVAENIPASSVRNAGWQLLGQSYIEFFVGEYFAANYLNFFAFGINTSGQDDWVNDPAIKAQDAWNIDSKIDDGSPATGRVLSFMHARRPNCVVAANNAYDLDNTAIGCNLFFLTLPQ